MSPSSVTTQMINLDIFTTVRTLILQAILKIKGHHEVQVFTQTVKYKLNAILKEKCGEMEGSHQRCFNLLQDCKNKSVQQKQTILPEMDVLI
jgi:hypothetical protein